MARLEGLTVDYGALECGIRETCTIDGIRRLTGEVWDDAVCYSHYPIDIHRPDGNGIAKTYLEHGRVATEMPNPAARSRSRSPLRR